MSQTIFITGTDTGVGKTIVTASFLFWLRHRGIAALGVKPFCSGSRADVRLIQSVQHGELNDNEVNPFFFREPVTPLIAARQARRTITLAETVTRIRTVASRCDVLVVEGAGGLLSPIGPGFAAADLIVALQAKVCLVAADRLGTLNHSLLTEEALAARSLKPAAILLGQTSHFPDPSARTNHRLLSELLSPVQIIRLSYLGQKASAARSVPQNAKRTGAVWAKLWKAVQE